MLHFCYVLSIADVESVNRDFYFSEDFNEVADLFKKLAALELPVSLSYESWSDSESD